MKLKFNATTAAVLCTLGFCITSALAWRSDNGDGTFTKLSRFPACMWMITANKLSNRLYL